MTSLPQTVLSKFQDLIDPAILSDIQAFQNKSMAVTVDDTNITDEKAPTPDTSSASSSPPYSPFPLPFFTLPQHPLPEKEEANPNDTRSESELEEEEGDGDDEEEIDLELELELLDEEVGEEEEKNETRQPPPILIMFNKIRRAWFEPGPPTLQQIIRYDLLCREAYDNNLMFSKCRKLPDAYRERYELDSRQWDEDYQDIPKISATLAFTDKWDNGPTIRGLEFEKKEALKRSKLTIDLWMVKNDLESSRILLVRDGIVRGVTPISRAQKHLWAKGGKEAHYMCRPSKLRRFARYATATRIPSQKRLVRECMRE